MARTHIKDRMPPQLLVDLYNRRVTVRDAAKAMGVSENYLSHAIPERAPKRNPKLLKVTRRLFQEQIAREVMEGKHTVYKAAELAHVSERTMFRRLEALRKKEAKMRKTPTEIVENVTESEQIAELSDNRVSQ